MERVVAKHDRVGEEGAVAGAGCVTEVASPTGRRLVPEVHQHTSRKGGNGPGRVSPLVPVQTRTGTNGGIGPGS